MINPNVAQKARPIMATIDDHLTVGPDRRTRLTTGFRALGPWRALFVRAVEVLCTHS